MNVQSNFNDGLNNLTSTRLSTFNMPGSRDRRSTPVHKLETANLEDLYPINKLLFNNRERCPRSMQTVQTRRKSKMDCSWKRVCTYVSAQEVSLQGPVPCSASASCRSGAQASGGGNLPHNWELFSELHLTNFSTSLQLLHLIKYNEQPASSHSLYLWRWYSKCQYFEPWLKRQPRCSIGLNAIQPNDPAASGPASRMLRMRPPWFGTWLSWHR